MILTRYLLFGILLLSQLGVSAQSALTKVGSITVPSYAVQLAVSGTTAYVLTASAGTQRLLVYDVSVPATPQLISTLDLPTQGLPPRHVAISNKMLCISTFPSFNTFPHSTYYLTVDVSNPAAPTVRKVFYAVGGDELFLAATGNNFYTVLDNRPALDVFDSNLNFIRTVNLPYSLSGIIGLSANSATAYVQYANPAFATLDLTDPAAPVSSPGTTPGTISAASNGVAYGLQQPTYQNSVLNNTLLFYDVKAPLAPRLVRSIPGTFGTHVAADGQSVFTIGATSPYLATAASSSAPLRGYYLPVGTATAAVEAVAPDVQGANALAVVNNIAYVLADTNLSIYSFPTTVTATRGATVATTLACYPNPATTTVRVPGLPTGSQVHLLDALGRLARSCQVMAGASVSVQGLAPGLYMMRATTVQGGQYTSRLLVQ